MFNSFASPLMLFGAQTANGHSPVVQVPGPLQSFQATVTGTGAVTATITINVSNDNLNWIELGVITLSGTTTDTGGFQALGGWVYTQAVLSSLTGTGATVTAIAGS